MIVLLYHRIAQTPTDPQLLCVSPANFAGHANIIRQRGQIVALADGLDHLNDAGAGQPSVAITFDDGYADNLEIALPILSRFNAYATIFVTAGQIDSNREFWWDELDALLLQPGRLPGELSLSTGEKRHQWQLNGSARYDVDAFERHRSWNILQAPPTARHQVYAKLCTLLRPMDSAQRERVLNDVVCQAIRPRSIRPTHRTLSSRQLTSLSVKESLAIGAHTM